MGMGVEKSFDLERLAVRSLELLNLLHDPRGFIAGIDDDRLAGARAGIDPAVALKGADHDLFEQHFLTVSAYLLMLNAAINPAIAISGAGNDALSINK